MDKGMLDERDNPKALLVPGTVPLPVHNLVNMNDSSDSEDNLPSTIDFDALKIPGLAETTFGNVMSWRGGTPRAKPKQGSITESPKKDSNVPFLVETGGASISDASKSREESSSGSEDSESDSDSSSESDSSSGSSPSSPSASSGSEDSESKSSETDSSGRKVVSKGSTPSVGIRSKSISPRKATKESRSVSNSSSSSRRKNKSFTTTNYEPGSLKLRLSVFHPNGAKESPPSTKEGPPQNPPPSTSGSKWKTARLTNGAILSNGNCDTQVTLPSPPEKEPLRTKVEDGDSKRLTRHSLALQNSPKDSEVATNGLLRSLKPGVKESPLPFHFGNKNFVPVGETSQLTESVTMTRVSAPLHSMSSTLSLNPLPAESQQGRTGKSQSAQLSDPVRYLAEKKSHLTISPISPDGTNKGWSSPISRKQILVLDKVVGPRKELLQFPIVSSNGNPHRLPSHPPGPTKEKPPSQHLSSLTSVNVKLPPKLDVSIRPILHQAETHHPRNATNKQLNLPVSTSVSSGSSRAVGKRSLDVSKRGGASQVTEKKKKESKSTIQRNRSKLSVFLPPISKSNGKLSSSGDETKNGRTFSSGGMRRRLRGPITVIGGYTNSGTGKIMAADRSLEKRSNGRVVLTARMATQEKQHQDLKNKEILPVPPIPAGLRTKAAKKYIPDPVPEVTRKGRATKLVSGGKRSVDESRVSSFGKKKKGIPMSPRALSLLCDRLEQKCKIEHPVPVSKRKSRNGSQGTIREKEKEGFTFERKVFKDFNPPFPIHALTPTTPKRDGSSSKSPVSRTVPPSSGRRKRSSILPKCRSSSSLDYNENGTPDLQKLPLKKRHGHGNQHYDGPSSEDGPEETIHTFGTLTLTPSHIPTFHNSSPPFFNRQRLNLAQGFLDVKPELTPIKIQADEPESTPFGTPPISPTKTEQIPKPKRGRPRKSVDSGGNQKDKKKEEKGSMSLTLPLPDPAAEPPKRTSRRSGKSKEEPPLPTPPKMEMSPRKTRRSTKVKVDQESVASVEVTEEEETVFVTAKGMSSDMPLFKPSIPVPTLIVRDEMNWTWSEEQVGDADVIDMDAPIELIDLSEVDQVKSNTPAGIQTEDPPPTGGTGGKRKRKINRTGFPTSKKKKRKRIEVNPEGGVGGPGWKLNPDEVSDYPEDEGTESGMEMEETNKSGRWWTSEAFSSSLTERVKMRRRNSFDLISTEERDEIAAGILPVPGVIPSFMDVPNPPIILPHKSNYLQAGFLSGHYKSSPPPPPIDENLSMADLVRICSNRHPLTKESLCPPPADTGTSGLRLRGGGVQVAVAVSEEYQLPFDIWCLGVIRTRNAFEDWAQLEEKRRGEEADQRKKGQGTNKETTKVVTGVKRKRVSVSLPEHQPDSWTFKRLRINAYSNKPSTSNQENDDQLCECGEGEFKCGTDDCLNRVVFTECPFSCGEKCRNRRIQKHDWAPQLTRFMTEDKGYGVMSLQLIKKGEFILEYVGEVVTAAEFKERMTEIYVNDTHHYCLQLDSGLVIDGHRSGGKGRFVNHSCEPNCHMQKWSVNGLSRMALFALRDIPPEEELSYDYNFSLYNETEGQPCYCGSTHCRGVIGGKSKVSRRKNVGRLKGLSDGNNILFRGHLDPNAKVKVLSRKEIKLARGGNVFLVRNYEGIRRMRSGVGDEDERISERVEKLMSGWVGRYRVGSKKNKPLDLSGEEPKVSRLARISQIFFELYKLLTTAKDTSGRCISELFMEVPLKRSFPIFHSIFEKKGQLTGFKSIEKNILRGRYKSLHSLEEDIGTLLTTFAQAYESEKPEAKALVDRIKKIYKDGKQKAMQALDPFIVPSENKSPERSERRVSEGQTSFRLPKFLPPDPTETTDRIRCICGTFVEDGRFVQCEKCMVWQHCDCVGYTGPSTPCKVSTNKRGAPKKKMSSSRSPVKKLPELKHEGQVEFDSGEIVGVGEELPLIMDSKEDFSEMDTQVLLPETQIPPPEQETRTDDYYCEECQPRKMDEEIRIKTQAETPDQIPYLTLKRDDGLVLRKNDTVYVLRDWPIEERILPDGTPRPRTTYLNAGPLVKEQCDIFRIDSLWKDGNGNRMVRGYNYLRPRETHHEPTRRFYPNEILRAPIHEIINIELVHGRCWVLDTPTYCKGRPIGCLEDHLYICDIRVNKSATSFDKVGKRSQAVNTKSYAFQHFVTKIKINRNVHPHGPPSPDFKIRPSIQLTGSKDDKGKSRGKGNENKYKSKGILTDYELNQIARKRWEQRENLHGVVSVIGGKIPDFTLEPIDLSNLLTKEKKNRKNKGLTF